MFSVLSWANFENSLCKDLRPADARESEERMGVGLRSSPAVSCRGSYRAFVERGDAMILFFFSAYLFSQRIATVGSVLRPLVAK